MLHCMLVEMQKKKKKKKKHKVCTNMRTGLSVSMHRPLSNGWSGRQALLWYMRHGRWLWSASTRSLSTFSFSPLPFDGLPQLVRSCYVEAHFEKLAFKIPQSFSVASTSMPLGGQSDIIAPRLRWAVTAYAMGIGERSCISRKCSSLQSPSSTWWRGWWSRINMYSSEHSWPSVWWRGPRPSFATTPHTFTDNGNYGLKIAVLNVN